MIILTKMVKYNCNKEIGKEVIIMGLYSNHYPESADLTLNQISKIERHYQMLIDGYEDQVERNYSTLTAILKDGTTLSGDDLGDLIGQNLSEDNFKQLLPVLNDVYEDDIKSFNSLGIYSGKDLGETIINDCSDFNFYQRICQAISETSIDLHDYPSIFSHVYNLEDEDDLRELAEEEYQGDED